MRRLIAVAALILAASPSFAAGSFCTKGVQDTSGFHLQSYLDESG